MYIEEIAYHLGRRDEEPNKALSKKLADEKNRQGIKEIASFLKDKNKSIASDCIAVLYTIGYDDPSLITDYFDVFLDFLNSKNNRMVWGSMIGLAQIAKVMPDRVLKEKHLIIDKIETGTVITNVAGVEALVNIAACGEDYYKVLKPTLFDLQDSCRPIDFPKRAEMLLKVIPDNDLDAFIEILDERRDVLSKAGIKRMDKATKKRRT